jgi:hypothetical protein
MLHSVTTNTAAHVHCWGYKRVGIVGIYGQAVQKEWILFPLCGTSTQIHSHAWSVETEPREDQHVDTRHTQSQCRIAIGLGDHGSAHTAHGGVVAILDGVVRATR